MAETSTSETTKKFDKKYVVYGLLILLILVGAYFRFYHSDYPVIGYHNWKETHYLTEARNFARNGFFDHGFFVPEWDYPDLGTDSVGVHSDTFPTISIITAVAFKIFGESLFVARFVTILFSLGVILMMFLVVQKLFNRDDMALVAAALTAINPLLIFFGRNVQLINPALLFMLLSLYFFIDWRDSFSLKTGLLAVVFLMLTGLTKYSFLIIALPMLATIPYKKLLADLKPNLKTYLIYVAIMLPLPLWFIYSKIIESRAGITSLPSNIIELGAIFTKSWWSIMKSYCSDNYTLLLLFASFVGLGLIYLLGKEKFGNKFTLYYAVGTLPWIIIMSSKLSQHSYHQYPVAPLVIISASYLFTVIGTNLAGMVSKGKVRGHVKYAILLLLLLLVLVPSGKATDRQFDTQFLGLDIAGEYINEYGTPGSRIIFPRGQSFGVLWHADKKGYGIQQPTKEQIIEAEQNGVEWVFLYQWGLSLMNDPVAWAYLEENYNLEQVSFLKQGEQNQLVYVLLKKGGSFNEGVLNNFILNHKVEQKSYMFSGGGMELSYASADN
ncbi:MAG: glycosyltransferase family 39 protein [archaeon]